MRKHVIEYVMMLMHLGRSLEAGKCPKHVRIYRSRLIFFLKNKAGREC